MVGQFEKMKLGIKTIYYKKNKNKRIHLSQWECSKLTTPQNQNSNKRQTKKFQKGRDFVHFSPHKLNFHRENKVLEFFFSQIEYAFHCFLKKLSSIGASNFHQLPLLRVSHCPRPQTKVDNLFSSVRTISWDTCRVDTKS